MGSFEINYIVNCAHANCEHVGQPPTWMARDAYRWPRFVVRSAPTDKLRVIAYCQPPLDVLQQAFQKACVVRVHCKAGAHRAATVVAAVLVTIRCIKQEEAIRIVVGIRTIVTHHK